MPVHLLLRRKDGAPAGAMRAWSDGIPEIGQVITFPLREEVVTIRVTSVQEPVRGMFGELITVVEAEEI